MEMKTKLFFIIAIALLILIPSVSASDDLIIVHTNDVHARYADNLGYAAAADIVDNLRENYENVILLDAGDTLNGKPEAKESQGGTAVEILNAMEYDAMTVGNHEFDYSLDVIFARESEMNFPLLAANIFYKDTDEPVFQENTIIETGNWKIGIFGLTAPKTVTTSSYGKDHNLYLASGEELYKIAWAQIDELKSKGCNFIICLAHLGMSEMDSPDTSVELMKSAKGIDLCVDGHSHTTLENGYPIGDSMIVSTGCYLNALGVVKVSTDKKITAELINSHEGVDSKIDEMVKGFIDEAAAAYSRVIGYSEVFLNGERNPGVRNEETNLGDFAADALYNFAEVKGAEPDFALINGGGLRTSISVGNITLSDLITLEPFGNTVVMFSAEGKNILQAIEDNTALIPQECPGFPQVSGLVYSIDTSKEYKAGEVNRVKILSVGGERFDENRFYNVSSVNFIAKGGDAYSAFEETKIPWDQKFTVVEAYEYYIAETLNGTIGEIYSKPQNRVLIFDGETFNLFSGKLIGSYSFVEISEKIHNMILAEA